jgi:hypothetical protein
MEKSVPPLCSHDSTFCKDAFYLELTPPQESNGYCIKFTPSGRFKIMKFCEGHTYDKKIHITETKLIKYVGFDREKAISECQYRFFSFNDNKTRFHFIGTCSAESVCNMLDLIPRTFTIFSGAGSIMLCDMYYNFNEAQTEAVCNNPNVNDMTKFFKSNCIIQPALDAGSNKSKELFEKEKIVTNYFVDMLYENTNKKVTILYTNSLTRNLQYSSSGATHPINVIHDSIKEHESRVENNSNVIRDIKRNKNDRVNVILEYPYFKYLILNNILKYEEIMRDTYHFNDYGAFILVDLIAHKLNGIDRELYKNINVVGDKNKIYELNDTIYPIVEQDFFK